MIKIVIPENFKEIKNIEELIKRPPNVSISNLGSSDIGVNERLKSITNKSINALYLVEPEYSLNIVRDILYANSESKVCRPQSLTPKHLLYCSYSLFSYNLPDIVGQKITDFKNTKKWKTLESLENLIEETFVEEAQTFLDNPGINFIYQKENGIVLDNPKKIVSTFFFSSYNENFDYSKNNIIGMHISEQDGLIEKLPIINLEDTKIKSIYPMLNTQVLKLLEIIYAKEKEKAVDIPFDNIANIADKNYKEKWFNEALEKSVLFSEKTIEECKSEIKEWYEKFIIKSSCRLNNVAEKNDEPFIARWDLKDYFVDIKGKNAIQGREREVIYRCFDSSVDNFVGFLLDTAKKYFSHVEYTIHKKSEEVGYPLIFASNNDIIL